jgi:nucleoside-triphosphatase
MGYLLTGKPRIGKTSVIKKIIENIGREYCDGFYTEEIRADDDRDDKRIGFRLVTLDGSDGILAHVSFESPFRLGRYGINLECLETIGVVSVERALAQKKLAVIDEIGPIQAGSEQFKRLLMKMFQDSSPFLGTIALQAHPWLDMIKQKNVEICELTANNRIRIIHTLTEALHATLHTQ